MALSKPAKVLIAALSCWPFLYMGFFFVFIFSKVFLGEPGPVRSSSGPPTSFKVLFGLHFLTMLEIFGLLVFYIVYLFKSDRVAQDKKALWAVVLFMGNMLAMPVFFLIYIWPETPPPSK